MNFTTPTVRSMKHLKRNTRRKLLRWLDREEKDPEHAMENEMMLWSHDQVLIQQLLSSNMILNMHFNIRSNSRQFNTKKRIKYIDRSLSTFPVIGLEMLIIKCLSKEHRIF